MRGHLRKIGLETDNICRLCRRTHLLSESKALLYLDANLEANTLVNHFRQYRIKCRILWDWEWQTARESQLIAVAIRLSHHNKINPIVV